MLQSFIMKITQKTLISTTIILLLLILVSCDFPDNSVKRTERSGLYFDTYISITLYDTDDVKCADEALKICEKYDNLFSASKIGSDIYNINSAGTDPVHVDKDTCEMLELSQAFSQSCPDYFDLTIYPVSKLWDFHNADGFIPDSNDIKEAVQYVNFNDFSVDSKSQTVTKSNPDVQIDAGAVAKGYIADKLKEYLQSCQITKAVINMGGDLSIIGSKTNNSGFKIAIKNPNSDNDVLESLELSDICVATSGIYERCFEQNGKLYHHILDPHTGYPADTDIMSVSIISDSSAYCDMICTACIVMGLDNAMNYIENNPNIEAIILDTDGKLHYSGGIDKYLIKQ